MIHIETPTSDITYIPKAPRIIHTQLDIDKNKLNTNFLDNVFCIDVHGDDVVTWLTYEIDSNAGFWDFIWQQAVNKRSSTSD